MAAIEQETSDASVDMMDAMENGGEDNDLLMSLHSALEVTSTTARSETTPSPAAVSVQEVSQVATGRLPLCIYLTCDDDHFTKFQVLLRKQIEFFETTSCPSILNPKKQGRNKAIVLGQVGVRCMHCRALQMQEVASKGAVYYPSTLHGIYQAVQNMATHHYLADQCPNIPQAIKEELILLSRNPEKKSSGGKDMWARKAIALGVREDTVDGILRFQSIQDRLQALHDPH